MNSKLWINQPKVPSTARRITFLAASLFLYGGHAASQVPVDENGNPFAYESSSPGGASVENPMIAGSDEFSDAELETLVGPIALYPDDLLAVVLPAATYPLEIVQAARFLERVESDTSLTPDEEWDDSIIALLNYPDVVDLMNEDLDWTWKLGDAVVQQQAAVVLAIETFRDRAYAAGNLATDERQTVSRSEAGALEIEPVSEEVIYVPYYEPERVVYRSSTPQYHYYSRPYPVYYYPYPAGYRFANDAFWGVTTAFSIGWATNHLHVYHNSYAGHPYFGRHYGYNGGFWRRPSITVYNSWYGNQRSPHYRYRQHRGDYWRPRNHRNGARPATRVVNQRSYSQGSRRSPAVASRPRSDIAFRARAGDARRMARNNVARRDTTRLEKNRSRNRNTGPRGARGTESVAANRQRNGKTARRSQGGNKESVRFRSRTAADAADARQYRRRSLTNNAAPSVNGRQAVNLNTRASNKANRRARAANKRNSSAAKRQAKRQAKSGRRSSANTSRRPASTSPSARRSAVRAPGRDARRTQAANNPGRRDSVASTPRRPSGTARKASRPATAKRPARARTQSAGRTSKPRRSANSGSRRSSGARSRNRTRSRY